MMIAALKCGSVTMSGAPTGDDVIAITNGTKRFAINSNGTVTLNSALGQQRLLLEPNSSDAVVCVGPDSTRGVSISPTGVLIARPSTRSTPNSGRLEWKLVLDQYRGSNRMF